MTQRLDEYLWTKAVLSLINITTLAADLTHRYCEAVLGLHCFIGEDADFAFKGKGKVGPLKQLIRKQIYMDTFIKLGTDWELDQQTIDELEEFTWSMYGFRNTKSVDKVHITMLKKMTGGNSLNLKVEKKVDMS